MLLVFPERRGAGKTTSGGPSSRPGRGSQNALFAKASVRQASDEWDARRGARYEENPRTGHFEPHSRGMFC